MGLAQGDVLLEATGCGQACSAVPDMAPGAALILVAVVAEIRSRGAGHR